MTDAALLKKLLMKPGNDVLVLNAPAGYLDRLTPPPDGATITTTPGGVYDIIQGFVSQQADLDALWPTALTALKPGGILWLAYPKLSSRLKSDMSRDKGWDTVSAADWHGVTQIAIDADWSALRFRPRHEIAVMTRKF